MQRFEQGQQLRQKLLTANLIHIKMKATFVVTALLIISTGSSAKPVSNEEDTALTQISDWLPDDVEEKGDPSEFYFDEVREQVESKRMETSQSVPVRNTRSNFEAISQGNRIAIQSYNRRNWMSCFPNPCATSGYPKLYLEGADWENAWGQVFQIYRAAGPGDVKVGDIIAIYYPRESRWLGCSGSLCGKATCPGEPTVTYGFQDPEKWYRCWGEVFKIYVKGKAVGDTVNDHDDITIFYIQEQNWISLANSNVARATCPGTERPPPGERYDNCWGEVFEIWKG